MSVYKTSSAVLLLVVLASDIPLRRPTTEFFSVLFSSAYWSTLQAVTNIRWCVADCAIYTAWSSVTVFVTSWFARPAIFDSHVRPESRFLPIPHLHSMPPLGGFPSEYRHPVWYEKKLEWCGYPMVKKFRRYVYSF